MALLTRLILVSTLCLGLASCASLNPWAPPSAYVVFFQGDDTGLSANGRTIVARAASQSRGHPLAMVQVAGPATKVARGATQARIDAVVSELKADGVAEANIVRTSLTTAAMNSVTGGERVEIHIVTAKDHPGG